MSATFWNGIIADHAKAQVSAARPMMHRGWSIAAGRWPEPAWTAVGPNYDASYEGPEDGWVDNGEKVDATSYEALIAEIDAYIEEQSA